MDSRSCRASVATDVPENLTLCWLETAFWMPLKLAQLLQIELCKAIYV